MKYRNLGVQGGCDAHFGNGKNGTKMEEKWKEMEQKWKKNGRERKWKCLRHTHHIPINLSHFMKSKNTLVDLLKRSI